MRYRDHRFACDHPVAVLDAADRRQTAMVVNVSRDGARLARAQGLMVGQHLRVFIMPNMPPNRAEVRWVREGLAGLRFAVPLSPREIAMARKSHGHRAGAVHQANRLGLRELR
ncbi:PilZ domain-containing protein [Pararhodobacter oceanensis]|uniref:PilZ domain-containing protein n=1 Tax=Pararhodobacter oceanensis TaxID=2172121 RepID=UPI003A9038E8